MTEATSGSAIDVGSLFSLRGKVALVTGGSSGIGKMIAQGYVEAGAKVYIASRKADVCDQVARELSAIGPCLAIPADLATADGRRQLCEQLGAAESGLHVLVNNAGTNWGAPLDEYPLDGFRKVTALNAEVVFFLTRDLLPLLTRAATSDDPARVINIGSIDGIRVPFVENYAYSAAKAAVHHMTRVLAVKLGPRHVTVNAIAPGPFGGQPLLRRDRGRRGRADRGGPPPPRHQPLLADVPGLDLSVPRRLGRGHHADAAAVAGAVRAGRPAGDRRRPALRHHRRPPGAGGRGRPAARPAPLRAPRGRVGPRRAAATHPAGPRADHGRAARVPALAGAARLCHDRAPGPRAVRGAGRAVPAPPHARPRRRPGAAPR